MIKSGWNQTGSVKKGIYLIIIACSIGICFVGINSNADQERQQKLEYAKDTIKNETAKIQKLDTKIDHFYQNKQDEFLAESTDTDAIIAVEKEINALKTTALDFGLNEDEFSVVNSEVVKEKKRLILRINETKTKKKIQEKIVSLLDQAPADWSVIDSEVIINEKTTLENIMSIKKEISGTTGTWSSSIDVFLKEMETQVTQYNTLNQSIDSLVEGETLSSNASMESFIACYNQLELIKNETLRKMLTEKLDVVDQLLNNQAISQVEPVLEEELPSE